MRLEPSTNKSKLFESLDLFNSKYSCNTCRTKLRTKADQVIHANYVHGMDLARPLIVNCLYCNLKFTSLYKLRLHLSRMHLQERPYGCKQCKIKFASFGAFKQHFQMKHYTISGQHIYDLLKFYNSKLVTAHRIRIICNLKCLKCNFCSKYFISVPDFINHLNVHLSSHNSLTYTCYDNECKFIGNTNRHLIRHIQQAHFDSEQYFNSILKCCSLELENTHDLKRHFYEKHNLTKSILLPIENYIESFICEICNFESKNFCDLKHHSYDAHSQVYLDHVCNECDNIFPTEESLNFHMFQHTKRLPKQAVIEEKPDVIPKYQAEECDLCGLKFPSKQMCSNHKVLHQSSNPKRPYKCHLCIVSFSKANQLLRHMITHQKHGSDFSCEICYSTFSRKQDLERHMNFHLTK